MHARNFDLTYLGCWMARRTDHLYISSCRLGIAGKYVAKFKACFICTTHQLSYTLVPFGNTGINYAVY